MTDSLLIIDADDRSGLARHLRNHNWDVERVDSLAEARRRLFAEAMDPLLVLARARMPDGNALDLLEQLRVAGRPGEWVLLSGYEGAPDFARALRLGALNFLDPACSPERLAVVLHGARRGALAQRRLRQQAETLGRQYRPQAFRGHSESARRLRSRMTRLAGIAFGGLVITGESGTGRALVARILHYSGPRSGAPMIEVNCARLPAALLESALFGEETTAHGRKPGYLEQADGGTLFLDEIGAMDLVLQRKLLRALQQGQLRRLGGARNISIDVQVLVASNHDLEARVRDGSFREDLYRRFSAFELEIPALRDRLDDLEELVAAMVIEFNTLVGGRVQRIPNSVFELMRGYRWPGNVRELRNVVERCVLLADTDVFPRRRLHLASGPALHCVGSRSRARA